MSKQRCAIAPAIYARMVVLISERAEQLGYAIGVHGSLARDLDLMAAPWTEEASDPDTLVEAVREIVGGYIVPHGTLAGRWSVEKGEFVECAVQNPVHKPHGRVAWSINLGGGAYIDLSIMPKGPA